MENKKKIWTEPNLTVLVRRKPEEGVLDFCKVAGHDGPGAAIGTCYHFPDGWCETAVFS